MNFVNYCIKLLQVVKRESLLCGWQVLYQLADVNELLGDRQKAAEWFIQVLSVVPSDAGVLIRLGQLCDVDGDQAHASHYFLDSHRYDPSNIGVIGWLGKYYLESQLPEKVATDMPSTTA